MKHLVLVTLSQNRGGFLKPKAKLLNVVSYFRLITICEDDKKAAGSVQASKRH